MSAAAAAGHMGAGFGLAQGRIAASLDTPHRGSAQLSVVARQGTRWSWTGWTRWTTKNEKIPQKNTRKRGSISVPGALRFLGAGLARLSWAHPIGGHLVLRVSSS